MSTPEPIKIRTGRWGVIMLAAMTLMLWHCVDELLTVYPTVYTGKGAFLQAFSPEARALYFGAGAVASSVLCALLFPVAVLRRPYLIVSAEGVRQCGPAWFAGRKRIEWARVERIEFSKDSICIWPTPSDPDQRRFGIFARLIDTGALVEAMHPHRPNVVPMPPSIVAQRMREAELAPRARPRSPQAPIVVSSRGWTG